VPVSEPRHLLLGEEEDCVLLLVVGAVGQSRATAVSAVRLGAYFGILATGGGWPQGAHAPAGHGCREQHQAW
jgi:hypothetical protein